MLDMAKYRQVKLYWFPAQLALRDPSRVRLQSSKVVESSASQGVPKVCWLQEEAGFDVIDYKSENVVEQIQVPVPISGMSSLTMWAVLSFRTANITCGDVSSYVALSLVTTRIRHPANNLMKLVTNRGRMEVSSF